jgi:long-chain acyl-CoA synthetase
MSTSFAERRLASPGSARPWLDHYSACTPAHLEYPDEPVWSLLEHAANQFPHRVATRFFHESLTYEDLFERARRAAAVFKSLGVGPGDRVGLLLPNVPEYLIAAYGVWMAGGIVVSLSPLSVPVEIDDLLGATDCKVVVSLDLLANLVTKGIHRPKKLLTCSIAGLLSSAIAQTAGVPSGTSRRLPRFQRRNGARRAAQ